MRFHIGTSGWVYPHWRGRFFPRDLPLTEWLAWYVNHFDTVELNRSFYRLPTRENLVAWREATPARFRFAAFELRDPDWHRPELYGLLARHHAAVCVYELAHLRSPPLVTTDFLYLRLHGPGERYQGRYGRRALTRWASWLKEQPVKEAWVYFDNDQGAFAVRDALELRALLE